MKDNKQNVKDIITGFLAKYSMVVLLVVVLVAFQILTDGIFLKPINITNLILQNSHIIILSAGMLLVVLLGHVDLSVGSLVAVVSAMAGVFMIDMGLPTWVSVILSLLIGVIVGAWNGYWVAYAGIPAFIVTIAGQMIFRGVTQIILNGQSLAPFPQDFQTLSSGYLPNIGDGGTHVTSWLISLGILIMYVGMNYYSRKQKKDAGATVLMESDKTFLFKQALAVVVVLGVTYIFASYKGFPLILLMLAVLVVAYSFVTTKTVMGRQIYATGGNQKAAALSGIKTKKITFWVFVNMGVMAALAGLVLASRLNAATPQAGIGLETDALAAVYFGGASTSGGIGTVMGAIIGAIVMGALNNGMSILGIGIDWQQAIKGLILLLAVVLDFHNKKGAK